MKKLKWFLLVACVILVLGSCWFYFLLTSEGGGGSSYRLASFGGGGGATKKAIAKKDSISIEVAPGLAQDGVTALYFSSSETIEQVAFIQRSKCVIWVRVTAGKTGVEKLAYTLFGANGEKLSQGKVALKPLEPGESENVGIIDPKLPNASRIVIDK